MSRLIALTPLLTVVCLSAQQPAVTPRQEPGQAPMTFKVEVNYIEVDATVTDPQGNPIADLTPREREVLGLMAEGRSNAAVAEALSVSLAAVEKHTQRIFAKLGLSPDDDTQHRRVSAVLAFLRD